MFRTPVVSVRYIAAPGGARKFFPSHAEALAGLCLSQAIGRYPAGEKSERWTTFDFRRRPESPPEGREKKKKKKNRPAAPGQPARAGRAAGDPSGAGKRNFFFFPVNSDSPYTIFFFFVRHTIDAGRNEMFRTPVVIGLCAPTGKKKNRNPFPSSRPPLAPPSPGSFSVFFNLLDLRLARGVSATV